MIEPHQLDLTQLWGFCVAVENAHEMPPCTATCNDEWHPLTGQSTLYSQRMLPLSTRLDVMNRLGRAMADPSRSRILVKLLEQPGYPAELARDLALTRSNVSNHLSFLLGCGLVTATAEGRQTRYEISDPHLTHALVELMSVVLAVDEGMPCENPNCAVDGCCE